MWLKDESETDFVTSFVMIGVDKNWSLGMSYVLFYAIILHNIGV